MEPNEIPVTVLMTVYNGEGYLRSSIESVLNQSFRNFEFLIINDCSTDRSLEIIQSYHDRRLVVYSNEKNFGQTRSLNRGLKLARGKYIARMDADDLVFPGWLTELSSFLEQNPETAVVSAKAVVLSSGAKIVRILNTPMRWEEIVLKSLTFSPINHVGSLMRKEVVLGEMGGYDESYHVPADFHLWSRLIRQGHRLAMVPQVLVAIRFHGENQSKAGNSQEMIRIIHDNVRYLTNYPIQEQEAVRLYKLVYEVSSLDFQEFRRSVTLLKSVYFQIKPSWKAEAFIETCLAQQQKTATMKKIFFCVEKGRFEEVRWLSRDYIRQRGWGNVFSLIWLISFGGIITLRLLPAIHAQLLQLKMQFILKGETPYKRTGI